MKVREPLIPQPDIRVRYWGCADHPRLCLRLTSDYELVDTISFPEPVVLRFPAGFHYDGGSVPKIVRSFMDNDDLKGAGPLAHDAIYRYGGNLPDGWLKSASGHRYVYTRRQADRLFKVVLDLDGVAERFENWAWLGVRLGGWWSAWDSLNRKRA